VAGVGLCDEPGHWGIIEHFRDGKPGWPDTLPHPPGYHYAVLALTGGHPSPNAARLVTCLFALGALAAFAGCWRHWHGRPAGAVLLLYALLPILQPFNGMIYTDVPALALVLAGGWAQLSGRRWTAGAFMAAACFIRQTSVIWAACFIVFELLRTPSSASDLRSRLVDWVRTAFVRAPGLVAVHGAVAAVVLWAGRLTPGTNHGNAFSPNPATLYFGGALLFTLTLPLWFTHGPQLARTLLPAIASRTRRIGAILLGLAALAGLALAYRNPHVWNQVLWWDDTSFTLVRNWPLVAADRWPVMRWGLAALVVAGIAGAWAAAQTQRFRRELLVVAAFSIALLASNALVEPRYFITTAVLVLLLTEISARATLVLSVWFALICAAMGPLIATKLALW
jgi:hypothetical protein